MIGGAAAGNEADRRLFAERYVPVARAYLLARWAGTRMLGEVDDAIQEVFVEAFREGGALGKAAPGWTGGFRGFFLGVVRNVALRSESRRRKGEQNLEALAESASNQADEQHLSRIFDRAWAQAVMREAAERMRIEAAAGGDESLRRVDLLRLRFSDGMPIRRIAQLWNADAADLHREYARARKEFRQALERTISEQEPAGGQPLERRIADVLDLLQ